MSSPRPILKRSSVSAPPPPAFLQPQYPRAHHHHAHQYHHQHPSQHPNQPQPHAVHFPPSPSLTRTFSAYSASAYDRSPIVVTPNTCALPERGCPGRTYFDEAAASRANGASPCNSKLGSRGAQYARDYHPRALAFASSSNTMGMGMPQLIPDLSSESEESDGFSALPSPNPSAYTGASSYTNYTSTSPSTSTGSITPTQTTTSYSISVAINIPASKSIATHGYARCEDDGGLGYMPSPYSHSPASTYAPNSPNSEKPKRRRGERERRHESSRDPDRIRSGGSGGDVYGLTGSFDGLSMAAPQPPESPRRKSSSGRKHSSSSSHRKPSASDGNGYSSSSFGPSSFSSVDDDGCLGGF